MRHEYETASIIASSPRLRGLTAKTRIHEFKWKNRSGATLRYSGIRPSMYAAAYRPRRLWMMRNVIKLMSRFRTRASEEFLSAYWETSGTLPDTPTKCLLGLFLIEKAAYENCL